MKARNLFIFSVLITSFILVGCLKLPISSPSNQNVDIEVLNKPQPGEVAIIESNIIITKPLSNDPISNPLEITGRATLSSGTIFFRLRNIWGQVFAQGSVDVSGPGSWGFYSAKLEFASPQSPTGWFEVYTKNPENNSEENLIRLPVIFQGYLQPLAKIYFSNIKEDPEQLNCSAVYPVERLIAPTNQLVTSVLVELLKGLSEEEKQQGFITNIPEDGVQVQKIDFQEGNTLLIDFTQGLQEGVAGSCRVTAIRAQIIETLKQFSDVDEVVISIEGETEDILQP